MSYHGLTAHNNDATERGSTLNPIPMRWLCSSVKVSSLAR